MRLIKRDDALLKENRRREMKIEYVRISMEMSWAAVGTSSWRCCHGARDYWFTI